MSNPEERACAREDGPDCKYMVAAFYYWCSNRACCRHRGTTIPGVIKCPFYQPQPKPNPWWEDLLITTLLLFFVALTIFLVIGVVS